MVIGNGVGIIFWSFTSHFLICACFYDKRQLPVTEKWCEKKAIEYQARRFLKIFSTEGDTPSYDMNDTLKVPLLSFSVSISVELISLLSQFDKSNAGWANIVF